MKGKTALAVALTSLGVASSAQAAGQPHVNTWLPGHTATTWTHRCELNDPKVNGRYGTWNKFGDQLLWDHGQVQFNGVQFWNGSTRVQHVTAHCGTPYGVYANQPQ